MSAVFVFLIISQIQPCQGFKYTLNSDCFNRPSLPLRQKKIIKETNLLLFNILIDKISNSEIKLSPNFVKNVPDYLQMLAFGHSMLFEVALSMGNHFIPNKIGTCLLCDDWASDHFFCYNTVNVTAVEVPNTKSEPKKSPKPS